MDCKAKRALVETVCDRLVMEGKAFTAVDISNQLKMDGADVRHGEVAPIVRAYMFDLIDGATIHPPYEVTLVQPTTFAAPNGVFVYHPTGTDATAFVHPPFADGGTVTVGQALPTAGATASPVPPDKIQTLAGIAASAITGMAASDDPERVLDATVLAAAEQIIRAIPSADTRRDVLADMQRSLNAERSRLDKIAILINQLQQRIAPGALTPVAVTSMPASDPVPPTISVSGFSKNGKPTLTDGQGMSWGPTPRPERKLGVVVTESQGRVRVPGKYLKSGVTKFTVYTNGDDTILKPTR